MCRQKPLASIAFQLLSRNKEISRTLENESKEIMYTTAYICIILTFLKAKQVNVCTAEREHSLEICRITGKYEFLKNKAMYCHSYFCIYLKTGDKRKNKVYTFVRNTLPCKKMGLPS